MRREGFRLFVPHKHDCFVRDEPFPFVVYDEVTFSHNKNGVARGHTCWHTFKCNDPFCPARMGVRWDVLAEFVGNEVW